MQTHEPLVNSMAGRNFSLDTTFVLFFLALDFGQALSSLGIDGVFSVVTLASLAVLPYFLLDKGARPDFTSWILGRIGISAFAIGLGIVFTQAIGTVLPEAFRFVPMTLLIVSAMASCYIQFYGMLKFRWAK